MANRGRPQQLISRRMTFTHGIALITVLVSWSAFSPDAKLREQLVLRPWRATQFREYWRIFTHGFIHADWTHLLVNMFVFLQFAPHVEGQWGPNGLLGIYLGGILFATLPALRKHSHTPSYGSLGASGGVASILLAYIFMEPLARLYLFFVIPLPAWAAGILFFLYESKMQNRGGTHIAHDAHLYGAIWGLIFAIVTRPEWMSNWRLLIADF